MATTRTFSNMLNEYLPNELLKEELIRRDYLLSNIEKDDGWVGGNLVVPFKGAGASSVAFGSLSGSTDVAEDSYVRGGVASAKEVWGTMLFNHRDLMEHNQISEKNLLKILPNTVEDFLAYVKNVLSVNILNGAWFATLTADATSASGIITVDRPDRFVIGQKVTVHDTVNADSTGYVSTIDLNTKQVLLVTARGGASAVNFAAVNHLVANSAKCYNDGAVSNSFSSLRGALLSAANGGDSTLYGQTKTAYPYLQAINIDGSSASGAGQVTAVNIVEKIFDGFTTTRQLGKGNPTDVLMSYKNYGSTLKVVEASKGAFNVMPGSQKASQYGWSELQIGSVTQQGLKFVGIQEMDDDIIIFIDWRALVFYSNGFFRKRQSPDGIEYFEIRNTTGYQYLVDICCFGELVVIRPSYCGIIFGISY